MAAKAIWDAVWAGGGPVTGVELRREVKTEAGSSRCREILGYLCTHGLSVAGLRVVEVGCGSAIYGSILAQHGATVTAVDQSAEALARAQGRAEAVGVTLDLVQADISEFAEENGGVFDVAMSFGTVEHFRPPLRYQLCSAHAAVVRTGGVVILDVPNLLFVPHEILKRLLMVRKKWFLGYEGSLTPWELRRVGKKLDLNEVRFHGTDVLNDTRRYWRIVRGTVLWRRVLPWWHAVPGGDPVAANGPQRIGPLRALMNRYLGHDITLMGVKGNEWRGSFTS